MIRLSCGGFFSAVLLAWLLQSCSAHVSAQEQIKRGIAASESPEILLVKEIEDRVLPLRLVPGVPRYESLSEYYWGTNAPLHDRLDEAVRVFDTKTARPFRAMTVVAGSAGVGKTFIKQGIYRDWVSRDQIWQFDIRELFEEMADQGLAESRPDVHDGDQVISRLLSLNPVGRDAFVRKLNESSAAFVVVDSLDEIHPRDYDFVLNALEQFANRNAHDFVHVVVFGRPLAFRDFWHDRRASGQSYDLRGYVLNPPDFRTTGDLLVSSWNHDCWKYGLRREGNDGRNETMTFADYQRWCGHDFATVGEFADVTLEGDKNLCPQVRDELARWAQQHRVVAAVLPNLAGNSMLREIVEAHVESKQPFDEWAFMNAFFDRWLDRNTKSGDRPSRLKPERLDLYLQLLEAVAAKYVDEDRVDRLGYFDVVDGDRVTVQSDGRRINVPVDELLDHSGMVTLDPLSPRAQRYRFEPFWVHRFLLQKHHQRSAEASQGELAMRGIE